jgi:hypothetical protein
MKNKSFNLADKLFPIESDAETEILNIPPEKRKLNTETYDFTVSTISDYIDSRHMLIPEFQRGYVWNRSQASRLIESLIIQCPIPVIFLAQNADETLSVIDGNQRLNTINLFLNEEFALQGLTAYPELDGFRFSELDPRLKRHIQNRTIRCIVILKDTHPQIKFDVFERLNTGSVKLNQQELRHGIYHGELMEMAQELGKLKLWKDLSGIKIDKRMKSEELILRFMALADNWRNYQKPLSGFISNFAETNQRPSRARLDELKTWFVRSLEKCEIIYGDKAFRILSELKGKAQFNAALFDAQMIAAFETNINEHNLDKTITLRKLENLMLEDEFMKSISQSTTDRNSLQGRIRKLIAFNKSL